MYTVYASYAVRGGAPVTHILFDWPDKGGQRLQGKKLNIIEKRINLNGLVVKNSWNAQPPFVNFVKGPSGGVVDHAGFYVDVVAELQGWIS